MSKFTLVHAYGGPSVRVLSIYYKCERCLSLLLYMLMVVNQLYCSAFIIKLDEFSCVSNHTHHLYSREELLALF